MKTPRVLLLALSALAAVCLSTVPAWADPLRDAMMVRSESAQSASNTDLASVNEKTFLKTAEAYLIGVVAMVAVVVFLWIGYNLLSAEGDPEQFKKAQKALAYAVVGLAVIPLAYLVVRLAVSVNL